MERSVDLVLGLERLADVGTLMTTLTAPTHKA